MSRSRPVRSGGLASSGLRQYGWTVGGLVTNSIPLSWLLTIKAWFKKVGFCLPPEGQEEVNLLVLVLLIVLVLGIISFLFLSYLTFRHLKQTSCFV